RRIAVAGGDHVLGHRARNRDRGAEGRGSRRFGLRPARDRGLVDRRGGHDRPPDPLLLGRVDQSGREARPVRPLRGVLRRRRARRARVRALDGRILGAFLAGAIIKIVDRDQAMTHPQFRQKLEVVGFGVFIPFFFVTSGIRYDAGALFSSGSTLARVPLFLAILLAARGLPVLLYRSLVDSRQLAPSALLQATSVGFFVVATQIGQEMGLIGAANAAALIAAGMLSVILFPAFALTILRRVGSDPGPEHARAVVTPG
ncbi:MAG: hypothetical protein E6G31_02295, partial [Actinobacteria bacterium]